MGETTRIEVELDQRRYVALSREAQRLGMDVNQVVNRACAAWISEMCDEGHLTLAAESGMEAAQA